MKLEDIRKDIDRIDGQLVPLLDERMKCSLEVAKIKMAEGLPVYHPGREKHRRTVRQLYKEYISVDNDGQPRLAERHHV